MIDPELDEKRKKWASQIAELAVDALVNRGLVDKDKFDDAVEVVTEEIWVRLIMEDLPPR